MRHDSLAARSCEHIASQADYASRWNLEFHRDAVTLGVHGEKVSLAAGDHIYHLRGTFLWYVYSEELDRLAGLAVYFLDDNLRLTYLKFVTLATHSLNKH